MVDRANRRGATGVAEVRGGDGDEQSEKEQSNFLHGVSPGAWIARPESHPISAEFRAGLCYVRLSEHVTDMTLYSPLEDFMQRTVSQVPGLWAKLEYISSLRAEEGGYEHWGLARLFGNEAAQKAIEQAHRNLVLQMLRTPLSTLVEEAKKTAEQQKTALNVYVQELNSQSDRLLPVKLGGGSAKHFSSVLLALSCLVASPRSSKAATLRVS
jgi:hypothetical protein